MSESTKKPEQAEENKAETAPAEDTKKAEKKASKSSKKNAQADRIAELEKELEKLRAAEKSAEARLSNEAFISKAPPKVIEGAKRQLEDCRAKIAEISRLMGR